MTGKQWAGAALCVVAVAWWGLGGPAVTQGRERAAQEELAGRLRLASVPWSGLELERIRPMANFTVSGAGDAGYNGTYVETGTYNGRAAYCLDSTHWLLWSTVGSWRMGPGLSEPPPVDAYLGPSTTTPVGTAGVEWTAGTGTAPAPTVTAGSGNPGVPFTLTIKSPADAATVAGTIDVSFGILAVSEPSSWTGQFTVFCEFGGKLFGPVTVGYMPVWGGGGSIAVDTSLVPDGSQICNVWAVVTGTDTLCSDSHTVTVANVSPPSQRPTGRILAPANAASVTGTEAVSLQADDDTGLASAVLYLDYGLAGEATLQTFTVAGLSESRVYEWDSTGAADGLHTLTLIATDVDGLTSIPYSISVLVANAGADVTAPTVAITTPADAATVAGIVTVAATITDAGSGVKEATLYVDGAPQGTITNAPGVSFVWQWDSRLFPNATYALAVHALDNADNEGTHTHNVTAANSLADLTRVLYTLDPATVTDSNWTSRDKLRCIEVPDIDPSTLPADPAAQYNLTLYRECPIVLDPPDYRQMQRVTAYKSGTPLGIGSEVRWAMVAVPRQVWAYWETPGTDVLRVGRLDNGNMLCLVGGPASLQELRGASLVEFSDLSGLATAPTDMLAASGKVVVVSGVNLAVYDQDTGDLDFIVTPGHGIVAINQVTTGADGEILLACEGATSTGALYSFTYGSFRLLATHTAPLTRCLYVAGAVFVGDDAGQVLALAAGASTLVLQYDTAQAGGVTWLGLNSATLYVATGAAGKVYKLIGQTWSEAADLTWAQVNAIIAFNGWTYFGGPSDGIWREAIDGTWNISLTVPDGTAVNHLAVTVGTDADATQAMWIATSDTAAARLYRVELATAGDIHCGAEPPDVQFKGLATA